MTSARRSRTPTRLTVPGGGTIIRQGHATCDGPDDMATPAPLDHFRCGEVSRWTPWRFGLAGFEPGDRLGGAAEDFGQQLGAVVDPERRVGFLDGDGASGVADADLDLLPGDHGAAAATDPPVDAQQTCVVLGDGIAVVSEGTLTPLLRRKTLIGSGLERV